MVHSNDDPDKMEIDEESDFYGQSIQLVQVIY